MREQLADLCHRQWSGWMKYLFSKGTFNDDGTWTMPEWAVKRWQRQMNTSYAKLPENEQESDRKEADRFIEAITPLPGLLAKLSLEGGCIVPSSDCHEIEISDARVRGDFYVTKDGFGYVRRLPKKRQVEYRVKLTNGSTEPIETGNYVTVDENVSIE